MKKLSLIVLLAVCVSSPSFYPIINHIFVKNNNDKNVINIVGVASFDLSGRISLTLAGILTNPLNDFAPKIPAIATGFIWKLPKKLPFSNQLRLGWDSCQKKFGLGWHISLSQ